MISSLLVLALLQTAPRAPADPFANASPAELNAYRAVIETTKGKITFEFLANKAPETVRQFLRLAAAEVYDNTLVHRVLPNHLIQTGAPYYRSLPLTARQQRLIRDLAPEYNNTPFTAGVVGMAHGDEGEKAQTSFFVCASICKEFDGKYTAFARVVAGMPVVKAIAALPVGPPTGERPKEKVAVIQVTVAKKP